MKLKHRIVVQVEIMKLPQGDIPMCRAYEEGVKGVWIPSEGFPNDPVDRASCMNRINQYASVGSS